MFKGDDPRLERKLTFSVEGESVAAALARLSEITGVTMNAGLDENDWWVRDRRVIVRVTDMPLATLMQELSSILRFHWSRGEAGGTYTYRLWQDVKQREEEENLRSAERTAEAARAREQRENALADMVNLASLGSSDVAALKESDPWRYVLATEPLGRDVAEFVNSFPEARAALLQGVEASFPVSLLPAHVQSAVRRIAESYDSLLHSVGASEDHSGLLERFDRMQITINRSDRGLRSDLLSRNILGRITIGSGADLLDIPLFVPGSRVGNALGKAIVSLQSGVPREAVAKQLELDMEAARTEQDSTAAAARDISSDPALRRKVSLFDSDTIAPLPQTLNLLAEQAGLDVVSDFFPGARPTIRAGERTIGEHLEDISLAYGSSWEKSGRVLRFRDREWFVKRAWAVPDVWMAYWTERGKINGGLRLLDLMQIGCLRDEQIDHTIMTDPDLVRFGAGEAARSRHILRFFGALTDEQRSAMAESRLEVSSLNDEQWALLQGALATRGAAYAAVQKGAQFLRLTQSGQDLVEYSFAYYPAESEPAVVFTVTSGTVFATADEVPPLPNQ